MPDKSPIPTGYIAVDKPTVSDGGKSYIHYLGTRHGLRAWFYPEDVPQITWLDIAPRKARKKRSRAISPERKQFEAVLAAAHAPTAGEARRVFKEMGGKRGFETPRKKRRRKG